MAEAFDPTTSEALPGFAAARKQLATTNWIAKNLLYFLLAILIFTVGSVGSARFHRCTWVMTVHMRDMPDGTVVAAPPGDPNAEDLAAILRITLTAKNDGELMTVGRAYTAKEEVVQLSPKRAALYTATLRPDIAAVLGKSVPPPEGAATLTPRAEAAFREALSLYLSGGTAKSVGQFPPWGEWLRLFGIMGGAGLLGLAWWNRAKAVIYRSRGRERLALDQCPHCGHPLSLTDESRCPECGTEHAVWAAAMSVRPGDGVVNVEDRTPTFPLIPPP